MRVRVRVRLRAGAHLSVALGSGGGKHARRKSSSIRGSTLPTSHGFSLRATAPSAHAPRRLPFASALAAQAEPAAPWTGSWRQARAGGRASARARARA